VNVFYQPLIPEGVFVLDPEESRHCVKVLRKKPGDHLRLTDGKGSFYDAILQTADVAGCTFAIQKKIPEAVKNYTIHIAIAPTKNPDRTEWFVEKAVEFGVDRISFIECQNSERTSLKKDRLEKIAVSAMKQSLKASLPVLNGMRSFEEVISACREKEKYIAFVDETNPHHLKDVSSKASDYIVLIGPEGDFSSGELENAVKAGYKKVSLGRSRLRTETAGVAACHILNLINS
jgi:16S rRNA (uracil1498-N3)-methyltransferase